MSKSCPTCGTALTNQLGGLCPDCVGRVSLFSVAKTSTGPEEAGSDSGQRATFGDYEVLEEIARGGMGIVFKARQKSLNRLVALKLMRAGQFATAAELKRFRAEAEAAATLDHPNIMPIYEVGESEGRAFFSMKLLSGGSLRTVPEAALAEKSAAVLVTKVSRAIQFAHDRGILHRDLKPENILLDERGEPQVTDFGLAKRAADAEGLTLPGTVLGTPAYMAPEQAEGKSSDITVAADIYSLGAVLYFLLTGHAPFEAGTALGTMHEVVRTDPVPPGKFNSRLDPDLETIVLKCLEKQPPQRYRSASDLADDLDRWLRNEPVLARPSTPLERVAKWIRRHPLPATLLFLLFGALLLGGSGILWQWRRANREAASAREALKHAREALWRADLEHARSARVTGRAGARAESLEALREAARIRPSTELRNEAIAALSLVDLGEAKIFMPHPPGAERAQQVLLLPQVNHDLTVAAWPLEDGGVVFRRLKDQKEVARLPSRKEVSSILWSGKDRFLAVRSLHRTDIWDLRQTNIIMHVESDSSYVHPAPAVSFSSDENYAATATEAAARVHRLPEGKEIWRFNTPNIPGVALHPSRPWIAIAVENEVELWDFAEDIRIGALRADSKVLALHWSPDGRVIVGVQDDKNLCGFDVFNKTRNIYEGHTISPEQVDFSPSGAIFASSTSEGNTRLWDTLGCYQLTTTEGGTAIRFDPEGKRLAFARPDGVGVWPVATGSPAYRRLFGRMDFELGHFIEFSADGRWIFSISNVEPGIWAWSTQTGELLPEPLFPTVFFSWIGLLRPNLLGFIDQEGLKASTMDPTDRRPLFQRPQLLWPSETQETSTPVVLSRSVSNLFLQVGAKEARLFDLARWQPTLTLKTDHEISSASLTPDGRNLAVGALGGDGAKVFALPSLQPIWSLPGLPCNLQFSPNGRFLAIYSAVACEVWEVPTRRRLLKMPRDESDVQAGHMTFSPDGQFFVYVRNRNICEMFQTGSWEMIARFEVPAGPGATTVRFSPDGQYLCFFGKAALHLYHLPSLRSQLAGLGLDW